MWDPDSRHARSTAYFFASGLADARYPRANPNVVAAARRHLPDRGGRLIDFGCGHGRHTVALASERTRVAAFDLCHAARDRLRARVQRERVRSHVDVLGADPADLDAYVRRNGKADVLLAVSDAIAHVPDRATRIELLHWLGTLVKPGGGQLIVSVSNRHRRFATLQPPRGEADGVPVRETVNGTTLEFMYRLYDVDSLRAELAEAGLVVGRLVAASLLPEPWLARSALLRVLERGTPGWLPPRHGYSLLATARPSSAPAGPPALR